MEKKRELNDARPTLVLRSPYAPRRTAALSTPDASSFYTS
jgi:hypothetical protein